MIARIRGQVVEKSGEALVVECAGVGYEVHVRPEDFGGAKLGGEVTLYTYDHVREDIRALYGFGEVEAKRLFEQLLGVNGVGPKVAMAIVGAASLKQLQNAIAAGDPQLLRGVSGVGKKTAERVVLELAGKLETSGGATNDPTYQALVALGYSNQQAAEAAASVPEDITDDQARIKAALKFVAK